jgi:hypothetical protein
MDIVDNIPVGLFGLQRKTASHPLVDSFNIFSVSGFQFFKGTILTVAPKECARENVN